jgi:hypothetical protein
MSHRQPLEAGIAVLAVVDSVAAAAEAVAAGAAVVDAVTGEALVANIKEAGLDVLVCGPGPAADLTRYALAEAQEAVRQGVPREHIIAEVIPDQLEAARGDGWLTLVDVDADPDVTASAREAIARAGAIATVSTWLGANVIATKHVREIRRCLDMTESIRGTRPPAWAVRGLG